MFQLHLIIFSRIINTIKRVKDKLNTRWINKNKSSKSEYQKSEINK